MKTITLLFIILTLIKSAGIITVIVMLINKLPISRTKEKNAIVTKSFVTIIGLLFFLTLIEFAIAFWWPE
jgi:hypothetical protein